LIFYGAKRRFSHPCNQELLEPGMKTDEKVVKWEEASLVERFGFMLGLLNDE
jgi:hypothetical protein